MVTRTIANGIVNTGFDDLNEVISMSKTIPRMGDHGNFDFVNLTALINENPNRTLHDSGEPFAVSTTSVLLERQQSLKIVHKDGKWI